MVWTGPIVRSMAIDDQSLKQATRHQFGTADRACAEGGKYGLRFVEDGSINDCLVLALVDGALVLDLADVEAVGQQAAQRAVRELPAAVGRTKALALLGLQPLTPCPPQRALD